MIKRSLRSRIAVIVLAALATGVGLTFNGAAAPAQAASFCSVPTGAGWIYGSADTWTIHNISRTGGASYTYVGGACGVHDQCYNGLYGYTRLQCDNMFRNQLQSICDWQFSDTGYGTRHWRCSGFVHEYYWGVRAGGWKAWNGG